MLANARAILAIVYSRYLQHFESSLSMSKEIWEALNIEVLRADKGVDSSAGMQGWRKREIPEKIPPTSDIVRHDLTFENNRICDVLFVPQRVTSPTSGRTTPKCQLSSIVLYKKDTNSDANGTTRVPSQPKVHKVVVNAEKVLNSPIMGATFLSQVTGREPKMNTIKRSAVVQVRGFVDTHEDSRAVIAQYCRLINCHPHDPISAWPQRSLTRGLQGIGNRFKVRGNELVTPLSSKCLVLQEGKYTNARLHHNSPESKSKKILVQTRTSVGSEFQCTSVASTRSDRHQERIGRRKKDCVVLEKEEERGRVCEEWRCLVCVVDAIGVVVGHVGDDGGGRVGHTQETSGGGVGTGCQGRGGVGTGCQGRGGVGSYGSVVGGYGSVVGGAVGQGVVAYAHVRLGDAGVRGVDGLGVGGHLSQVAGRPQDVGVLGGDGSGGGDAVGVCGGGIRAVGGGAVGSHCRGAQVASPGHSHDGGENDELEFPRNIKHFQNVVCGVYCTHLVHVGWWFAVVGADECGCVESPAVLIPGLCGRRRRRGRRWHSWASPDPVPCSYPDSALTPSHCRLGRSSLSKGGEVVNLLTSHQGRVTGLSQVGTVPGDAVGARVFSGISKLTTITVIGSQDLDRLRRIWSSARMQGQGKREIPEKKTHPLVASSDSIPPCENPGVIRPRIETGWPWCGGRSLERIRRVEKERRHEDNHVLEEVGSSHFKETSKRDTPEKTLRPVVSYGRIAKRESPGATAPGTYPGSPSCEASVVFACNGARRSMPLNCAQCAGASSTPTQTRATLVHLLLVG
ncbi:hypothetical protein PR048_024133 [Dryococelus australis]|uniref:Uncharacterized protein n=1 Tax=Dryococelus australis TaxID=614101 RepID=A0ABQ9GW18_9NEOP|nr:hypothetical protein PR048_024133 [Dryococelus australis]